LHKVVDVGRRWLNRAGSGLPGRLKLVLYLALAVVTVDHAAKLVAAWLEPAGYVHNPAPIDYEWAMLVPALVLVFPSRVAAALFAVLLGGAASNLIDVYAWPGGVPDFIPLGEWMWNPADFAIYGAIFALMAWPVWVLFQIARRHHPIPLPTPTEVTQQANETVTTDASGSGPAMNVSASR
jgi:hypothetical protein